MEKRMAWKPHCKECNIELTIGNIKRLDDLDFAKIGSYCSDCFPAAEQKLKEQRFVEQYKGNNIYSKDGKYAPYWHSWYYFNTIEDAKKRIDNDTVAYVNPDLLRYTLEQ